MSKAILTIIVCGIVNGILHPAHLMKVADEQVVSTLIVIPLDLDTDSLLSATQGHIE